MQIYMWEIRHSIGIARQYASNQMDLHMMVVSHLRRTYWTADLQNNLFTEALKILENGPIASEKFVTGSTQHQEQEQTVNAANGEAGDVSGQSEPWMQGTLEDFLHSFNPFMGLPLMGEDMSASVDWDLGPASPLIVDHMHPRLS